MKRAILILLIILFAFTRLPYLQDNDLLQQAKQDYKQGNYKEAIPKLKKAAEALRDPQEKASAYLILGLIYQVLNDEEQAKIQFSNAFIMNPDLTLDRDYYSPKTIDLFSQAKQEGMLRLKKGEDLYLQAHYEEALQQLHTGINLILITSPQIDRVHLIKAHFTAAKIYQVLNHDEMAVQEFQKALSINPELPDLNPELYSASTIQLFDKARLAGNQIVGEARRLVAQRNFDSAIQVLEANRNLYFAKGIKKDATFLLAKAYYSTKREGQAAEAVATLLSLDPAYESQNTDNEASFAEFFHLQKSRMGIKKAKLLIIHGQKNPAHDLAIQGFKKEIVADLAESDTSDLSKSIHDVSPQAIFVTGTDALLAVENLKPKIPVVFVNVPRAETLSLKQRNIGGIFLEVPLEAQFSFLSAVLPRAKKIGMLYNRQMTSELMEEAKRVAAEYGLEIVGKNVDDPEELEDAINSLKNIDVFWMTFDKSAVSSGEAFQKLLAITSRRKIPVFAYHETLVQKGALFSVSSNFEAMGKQAAELTQKLLLKSQVESVPSVFPTLSKLAINLSVAKKLNLDINPSVITSATLKYN